MLTCNALKSFVAWYFIRYQTFLSSLQPFMALRRRAKSPTLRSLCSEMSSFFAAMLGVLQQDRLTSLRTLELPTETEEQWVVRKTAAGDSPLLIAETLARQVSDAVTFISTQYSNVQ